MPGAQEPPKLLSEHFKAAEPQEHSSKWHELWEINHCPWDRGGPSMPLYDLLKENPGSLIALPDEKNPKKALVPGCGRGYDVLLLSSFGYDVYGLDVSPKAVEEAKANSEKALSEGQYPVQSEGKRGSVTWLVDDFFAQVWKDVDTRFDLIFDYTFFCALPPLMRPSWASRMRSLLAPGGRLVCLEFPSEKKASEGGPPWAAPPEEYVGYLSNPGAAPRRDENGGVIAGKVETPMPGSLKRLLHIKPKRTHTSGMVDGRVQDFISVWTQADELASTLT
ncbi:S-adenosyl-L-methionine-dependent methyltransferase [Xylariaceae sp. FL0594]|nr:S-adenosyl-L-methionine-dependent methyltransferase [Xylariaceae sp. FL0594]